MPAIQSVNAVQTAQNRAAFCSRPAVKPSSASARAVVVRGQSEGGPFAPLVVVTRNIVGKKEFNKFRGKAISIHSQVIKEFCSSIGADGKQAMEVIRLAKKNGEWLGFLA
eukprot:GFKZ01003706.1.p1 GENE.GFKZ01003706.1~~GFKZ01003706.1.p1  ORF type:complete len:123 (+),score=11.93 GFKZ01003706.1:40-369(+)